MYLVVDVGSKLNMVCVYNSMSCIVHVDIVCEWLFFFWGAKKVLGQAVKKPNRLLKEKRSWKKN